MVVVLIDLSYRMSYGIFLYFIHSVFQKTSSCFNILDIPDAISPVSITSYSFTTEYVMSHPLTSLKKVAGYL